MTPHNIILAGVVGSTAYGLAGPDSDVDRLGLFAVNTQELHVVKSPEETYHSTNPDVTYHEARKWCRLALNGNPTIMELVWLPHELYDVMTELGADLIHIRTAFLSASTVQRAYLGYATQQLKKFETRNGDFSSDTKKRTAKYARHLMRLCWQGYQLYTTGHLPIRVDEPQRYHAFGQKIAEGYVEDARALMQQYERLFDTARTPLPMRPDGEVVDSWLRFVRLRYLRSQ